MRNKWITSITSKYKYVFYPLNEEEYNKLVPITKREKVLMEHNEFPFLLKDIEIFGEIDIKAMSILDLYTYFPITPPYEYKGKQYGVRSPQAHFNFVIQMCGRPKYGVITKETLDNNEKAFWKIEKKDNND